ncbi:MAG: hypothetical protein KAI64_06195 [Thermoplasmata archaeon]|nr:hypothetical protein [Thermoplasmata archaeon]
MTDRNEGRTKLVDERIKRIEYRMEKEYVFDEAGDVVVSMQADLVWVLKEHASLIHEISVLRQLLDDKDGTLALETIEQQEGENVSLRAENEAVMMAANSLLGLIDCLGGRMSLDDAGPDRKSLAELVDYPDYMNKKIALLAQQEQDGTDTAL